MTTLTANVTATTRYWHISAPLAAGVLYLRAQSEVVEVRKAYSVANELAVPDPLRIYVRRGVGGTARASHSSGVTLTATTAFTEGGGGSLSVTDGTTTVDNVTTLQFSRTLTDSGGGIAAPFFVPNLPGYEVRGSDDASSTGAYVQVYDATDPTGGLVNIEAGDSDIGHGGGGITISGGYGNGAQTNPGQFIAHGGGAAADGTVDIQTEGSTGNNGQMLVANSGSHTVWRDLLSSGSGAPAGTFTTPLYVDTSGKHLYAWSGSAYVLVSDYA